MDSNKDNKEIKLELGEDKEIYRFFTTYYLHQDKLSWSRAQTMVAIEAGVLAAAFSKVGSNNNMGHLPWIVLLFGTFLIFLIYRLSRRDREIGDHVLEILDKFHIPKNIRVKPEPRNRWWRGRWILSIAVKIIIGINLIFSILFILVDLGFTTIDLNEFLK